MSTRCRIAVEYDGKFESIYCHHDGYLEYVGRKLQKHYNDIFKVMGLMRLGDISSLGDRLKPEESQTPDNIYSACRPYSMWGEDCPSKTYNSLKELLNRAGDCGEEFLYVYMPDYDGIYKWFVWDIYRRRTLEEELKALKRGEALEKGE